MDDNPWSNPKSVEEHFKNIETLSDKRVLNIDDLDREALASNYQGMDDLDREALEWKEPEFHNTLTDIQILQIWNNHAH